MKNMKNIQNKFQDISYHGVLLHLLLIWLWVSLLVLFRICKWSLDDNNNNENHDHDDHWFVVGGGGGDGW